MFWCDWDFRITASEVSDEDAIRRVWDDMNRNYYLSIDWSPQFYVDLAYQGFIAVAQEQSEVRYSHLYPDCLLKRWHAVFVLWCDTLYACNFCFFIFRDYRYWFQRFRRLIACLSLTTYTSEKQWRKGARSTALDSASTRTCVECLLV